MGKYLRKAKVSGEVAVMEVSGAPLGVRTRARTLALQRLQKSSPSPSPQPPPRPAAAAAEASAMAYLELRSRRLEKPTPPPADPSAAAPPRRCSKKAAAAAPPPLVAEAEEAGEEGVEVSFGENVLELEAMERSTRETTPCSLIRDSEAISTPGSTTRPSHSTTSHRRVQNSIRRNIPTSLEMDEFFAAAEQLQQQSFMEKYNYDPVNDCPLPGRYEWVKLDC